MNDPEESRPVRTPAVAAQDRLSFHLEMSNQYLAIAAWLSRDRMPDTARLFVTMSDAHLVLAHRTARLCSSSERHSGLGALPAPQRTFPSIACATAGVVTREAAVLAEGASADGLGDRRFAAGLAEIVGAQRRLARTATSLHGAAIRLGASPASLESWARRGRARLAAQILRAPAPRTGTPPSGLVRTPHQRRQRAGR